LSKKSLEETAVREILEDVKKSTEVVKSFDTLSLQIRPRHGICEPRDSALEDYERIPVVYFGMAMLKGMGWNPGRGIGKKGSIVRANMPQQLPRRMGLGADEVGSSSVPSSVSK
jgi:G patch domain/KOW motif-containing protein